VNKLIQRYGQIILAARNRRNRFLFIALFALPRLFRIILFVAILSIAARAQHGLLAAFIYWMQMFLIAAYGVESAWTGYSLWRDGKPGAL